MGHDIGEAVAKAETEAKRENVTVAEAAEEETVAHGRGSNGGVGSPDFQIITDHLEIFILSSQNPEP